MCTPLPPAILVLGDDPQFMYLIQRYALGCGCRCIGALNVGATLEGLPHEQPALIVLDIAAHSSGRSLIQRLKADPATRATPIAICSAVVDGVRLWEEQADYFLGKPVMYDDFIAILRKAGIASRNNHE